MPPSEQHRDQDLTTRALRRSLRRRLVWSATLAAGAVVGASILVPSYGQSARDASGLLQRQHTADARARQVAAAEAEPHADAPVTVPSGPTVSLDGHTHDHDNPLTKNSISRTTGDVETADTADPTTPVQAAVDTAAVARQRSEPAPRLVPLSAAPHRRAVPQNRYAMASGCYGLQAVRNGRWVARAGDGFAASRGLRARALPLHFQATDLGKYLLYGTRKDFVSRGGSALGRDDTVRSASTPSESGDWTVTRRGSTYLFRLGGTGKGLTVAGDGTLAMRSTPSAFRLHTVSGCAAWPEVQDNISGRTFKGASSIQEVRGLVDAHTHGMAFEFLGGDVHCGRPWHPYGVTYALKDCPDHYAANGKGAVLEDLLNSGTPGTGHDPVGWPTFKDWPAPHSLTHEGTYYKWMERAWKGGLRVFTNLLVENGKLCQVYPLKRNSCDDMTSIRLQARDMHKLERYVDAQYGGPGKGWYRIVTNPYQARRVVNQGKLAVVMGIETSVLFGCTMKADVPDPSCTKESIDRQLTQVRRMGVSQMELVNKFDNALSGVAGDEGQTGVAVNSANFLETGSFWDMRHCPAAYPADVHDKNQLAAPDPNPFTQRDALFGAIQQQYGVAPPVALPLYGAAPHCNNRGLTDLGAFTIRGMAKRHMIFDPDHMSVAGRKAALDLVESLHYPGVVSSHSWATPDAYPRIYRLGGFITPYAGDSTGFVEKWRKHLQWADPRYYFGFGYGADMNGLGAQGDPRGPHAKNPVTYPFRGIGGVTVHRQVSGTRVYDINRDGVAHYGLYPDWVQDLRKLAGNAIVQDMTRGPEAYLQMWERADGVGNDACRDPRALKRASVIRGLRRGATSTYVLRHAGQPHTRLGNTYGYCATGRDGSNVHLTATFSPAGRLRTVR
jgi:hypothetical protein